MLLQRYIFIFFLFLHRSPFCLPRLIRIGAIFTDDQKVEIFQCDYLDNKFCYQFQDSPTEMAFKYAVYKINKDPTIFANKTLTYDIQYVPREDSFRTTNKVKP